MSTRNVLAYCEWHGVTYTLYTDCMDDDGMVYLETWRRGVGSTTDMQAPPEVWEFLRGFASDVFRRRYVVGEWSVAVAAVERDVHERIEACTKNAKSFMAAMGEHIYGPWTDPYGTQIARGLAAARKDRAKVRRLRAKVEKMRRAKQ